MPASGSEFLKPEIEWIDADHHAYSPDDIARGGGLWCRPMTAKLASNAAMRIPEPFLATPES